MVPKLFLAAALFFSLNATAQSTQICAAQNNAAPARVEDNAYEAQLQQWIAAHPQNTVQSTITIPVVVHVVYKTAVQNISDAQVMSQIQVLNEDYGRTNADTVNTPSGFVPVAANTGIQFGLAQTDPLGNPTTGIEHISTTANGFPNYDDIKHTSTGGADAWDVTRYFNIWVGSSFGGMVGGGEFPTSTVSNTYGVFLLYSACGSNYTSYGTFPALTAQYDRGRVGTHEVAHAFNLLHTSTASSNCTDNDSVSDTPVPASNFLGSCPTYPMLDACNPVAPGFQFMNYMNTTTSESCMNMFTAGQAARMNAVLSIAPYNTLATSTACMPTGINTLSNALNFSVTPNPSAGKFTLQFKNATHCSISVYNEMGSVIKEYALNEGNETEIDLSGYADGVYFIRVLSEEGVSNRKIIISR